MKIFGVRCTYCGSELELLHTANGAVQTHCTVCGHTSRPEIKSVKSNVHPVYSKFARKSVDVQYSRPISSRPPSGTFRRVS